jgi:hypothetical protein
MRCTNFGAWPVVQPIARSSRRLDHQSGRHVIGLAAERERADKAYRQLRGAA